MTCKKCGIEHSSSWTCAQAEANQALWMPPPCEESQEGLDPEVWLPPKVTPVGPAISKTRQSRSERMKEWWRNKRAS